MKRIGIFSFYDSEGIVDRYIESILEGLQHVLERLIIVSNGDLTAESLENFQKYSSEIIIRENKGFDAGAYKDVLFNYIKDSIIEYDELVLCNDTFYGPFLSFNDMFNTMKNRNCDFWGINYVENNFANHLQSYFLVFRKKVLENMVLHRYFRQFINEKECEISYISPQFEIGMFTYLTREQGMSFDAVISTYADIYGNSNGCLIKHGLPIIKKKAFLSTSVNYDNIMQVLKYVFFYTNYNVEYILENISRIYGVNISKKDVENYKIKEEKINDLYMEITKVTADDLIEFAKGGKRCYIYGYTRWLSIVIYWSSCRLAENFAGYIVSDDQDILHSDVFGFPIYKLSQVKDDKDARIIVTLRGKNVEMVKNMFNNDERFIYLY